MAFIIDQSNILKYQTKYEKAAVGKEDEKTEKELLNWFNKNKYLDRKMFIKLCLWKSKRPKKQYEDKLNSNERIKEITSIALNSNDEFLKINILRLLKGVSWPVASVILHFAEPNKYMIMDFRAIWSLGWKQPKSYDFDFWQKYNKKVNEIAKKNKVILRQLDKALWFYSKENQK
jgi:hypothetical protein